MVWACFREGQERLDEKCIDYEVEGVRSRGSPKKAWRKVEVKDWQMQQLQKEDAVDDSKWRS